VSASRFRAIRCARVAALLELFNREE
jgi:hypothetical protein